MIDRLYSFLKKYKFKSQMFFIFSKYLLIQLIIFSAVVCIVAGFTITKIDNEYKMEKNSRLQRMEDMSNIIFTQIDRIGANLCVDEMANNYVNSENLIIWSGIEKELAEQLVYYKNVADYIDSIYIYSPKYYRICATNILCDNKFECENFADYEFLKNLENKAHKDTMTFPRKIGGRFPRAISLVKQTVNGGYVVINVNYDKYIDAIESVLDEKAVISVLDFKKEIIFPEKIEQVEEENITAFLNGEKKLEYSLVSVGYFEQYFVVKNDIGQYTGKKTKVVVLSFIALFAFICISILIAGILSLSSWKIVFRLYDVLDNKDFDISDLQENEEKYIITEVIRLMDDNREFKRKLEERLDEYNTAQITALQKQINPHFLNNILSTISYKIIEKEGIESPALKMIVMLTRIIRYGFNNDAIMVPLKHEMKFVEDYVKILREEYGNFDFIEEIPEEFMDVKVLRMSIQPLVENAVYHGIYELKGEGRVKISVHKENNKLIIVVEDNGVGMSKDKISEINNSIENGENKGHIGIYNVYQRMRVIYSDNCSLYYESDGKSGTKVTLSTPI